MTQPYVSQHFTDRYPDLKPIYEAMLEIGIDKSLLTFEVVYPLAGQLSEPNGNVDTDHSPELERVLRAIGMPFDSRPDDVLPTIIIKSQGVGYDWGNGKTSGWTTSPVPPGGWTQLPTETIDEVHLAALACTDSYWNVMPARFKTVSALRVWVPELFRIESVWELPRNREYLRARVWSVMAPSLALDARAALAMHRVMLPIDQKESTDAISSTPSPLPTTLVPCTSVMGSVIPPSVTSLC